MHVAAAQFALAPDTSTDEAKLRQVARDLEGQFAQMLVKSMREASFGDSLFGGQTTLYREMYDGEIARQLTNGRGLGLQEMIVRQLSGNVAGGSDAEPKQFSLASYERPVAALPLAPRSSEQGWLPIPGAMPKAVASDVWPEKSPTQAPASSYADAAQRYASVAPQRAADAMKPAAQSPEAFVQEVWPHAQRAADELGVDPRALVAQAALETGWGKHQIRGRDGDSANNLFGIKAGSRWGGDTAHNRTHEFVDGAMRSEMASFRAYASPAESFADYVSLLKSSPRYARALEAGTDTRRFAQALQQGGYATDPAYARKITSIAHGPTLARALAAVGVDGDAATGVNTLAAADAPGSRG